MNKTITDSFMIGQIKERIRRVAPKIERLDVKVQMDDRQGYLATIKFRSFGRDFIAKKAAPFYRESLEKCLRAINSQIDKARHKSQLHPLGRPDQYTTI